MPNEDVTTIWKMYKDSSDYLSSIGLSKNMPMWVKHYEGEQWPESTEKTKNLPRPVINILKMMCRNKKSAVASSPIKLHFTSDDLDADTSLFDQFAQYIVKEIRQDEADSRGLSDAVKKGTYVYHYYWDSEARGKNGLKEGAIRVENIEPLNVRVANPNQVDEQKQKWIMIVSREELDAVVAKADKKYKEGISADNSDSSYGEEEQEGTKYVTVLTRYFKKDGEVWFEKGTKTTLINDAVSLTPHIEKAIKSLKDETKKEDVALTALPEEAKEKEVAKRVFEVYPVVIGSWEDRDKCIYGIGEVESLLPNQKAINYGMGLQLLKLQDEAWGKWLVKQGALEGQTITAEVGQVLIDYHKDGDGVKKIPETPMSGTPMNIIQGLLDQTRTVTGSTEVMSGEIMGANMSGAAIATLQTQALRPIEELQQRFWRVKEKQGLVLAEFFKFYYEKKEFTYSEPDKEGKDIQKKKTFEGKKYVNTDFRVVVEAGAAASFSESGDIAMLEAMLNKGVISGKTFIKGYPKNALSNREEILRAIEQEEQGQIAQLSQQMQQAQQQMIKASEIIKAQSDTVNKAAQIINENQALKKELITLQAEYIGKINEANQALAQSNADAAEFAKMLQAMGAAPTPTSIATAPKNGA